MREPPASKMENIRSRIQRYRQRFRAAFPFISGVLVAFLALFLYNFLFPGRQPLTPAQVSTAIVSVMASATPRPAYSAQVYQVIQPSLVLIQTDSRSADGQIEGGIGSGVIINDQGDILTSLHIVSDATNISVTFADGTESDAFVLAEQPEIDIAVLRAFLGPELIVPATLGNPGAMRVGDEAYVVGNPFGLYGSMSAGVVSGLNRSFRPPNTNQMIEGLIQVDAAINPGNSGGPLLNRAGHVVGIVTGILNPTEDSFFIGIGFAVPINVAAAGGAGLPPY
ncbi:MAG TPA: trypsin-like peptidase domain-containing protein [Anaerolineales bacterium]|nr:trypsin-like peptidase domain-containing protein [Anaerolineales bacterium]